MALNVMHTFALLAVSKACYDEIAGKLMAAGYYEPVDLGDEDVQIAIDMYGIGLIIEEDEHAA